MSRKQALAAAVIVPLVVELFQLIVGRSFDVDDLICNFLGIAAGCLIAEAAKAVFCRRRSAGSADV